ncbi:MAG: acetylornithine deacetylase/succinyl-diaminopimelate desuccinylase family protein [Acidobacteria bacterium]|nr:acetylornithine deacetylase/succinyl-diaminopimelate desuccinylase family protein [Acidobacteriota bacterium]
MKSPQSAQPGESAVLVRVESMAEEMTAFLQELIRIPTINPPGENYVSCAELIGNRLKEFGYDVCYVAAEGRPEHSPEHPRVNVIGTMRGDDPSPLLHFNGHFDVVPAGEGWTKDPFAGVVSDGKVYGRGTADMKAGIAASIYAVEAIRRAGLRLKGTVEQSGTVDEESGGFAGVAYLAQNGFIAKGRTDFVIIPEPLNVDRICLGHRGVYWFKVTTMGRIAHGSMPFFGVSAIDHMAEFLSAVDGTLKPRLGQRRTTMPVEPPEARRPSINVNSIFGGQPEGSLQTPCVADRCAAIFDRRFLAEEPFEQVRAEICELLEELRRRNRDFHYRLEDLMTVLPVQTAPTAAVVKAVGEAIKDVLRKDPQLIASPGTYDQKHVMRLGLVEQCIGYGPGRLNLAHQPDEYCSIDEMVSAAKVMALTAMRLLGTA